jgi:hypothetical protein
MRSALLIFSWLLLTTSGSAQDRMTIPEAAARVSPGPLYKTRTAEVTELDVSKMVASSDLVLVGTLEQSRVYLSDDQTELYTEYRINPTEVVVQRKPQVSASPGAQPILMRQWGGRTEIGGVEVNVIDSNLAPLPTGVPLVLLLTRAADGVYELVGVSDGAFSARGGKVRAMRYPPTGAEKYREMTLGLFVAELRRLDVQPKK